MSDPKEITVGSWVDESQLPQQSVANFDRTLVQALEVKTVSDLNIDELLKVLITRGENQLNPALAAGATKLLRQLHREVLHQRTHHFGGDNRDSRGRGRNRKPRGRRSPRSVSTDEIH